MQEIRIIAGPCSIDSNNIQEIYDIASITTRSQTNKKHRAIYGSRIVGLKSRTNFELSDKNFLGLDADFFIRRIKDNQLSDAPVTNDLPPSVMLADKVVSETSLLIATEIMLPHYQLPYFDRIGEQKLLVWNPAVNQLGWPIYETARYCQKKNWIVGIKNGKWFDQPSNSTDVSTMERAWEGLVSFAEKAETILIHRGVDIPEKNSYRNYPVHNAAQRIKKATRRKIYLDPSHICGPLRRHEIVSFTLNAMSIKDEFDDEYLYDGILIEAGHAATDATQHISLGELQTLVDELSAFRTVVSPKD